MLVAEILEKLKQSNYGAYVNASVNDPFLGRQSGDIVFEQVVEEISQNIVKVKLVARNVSDHSVRLNSLLVADFVLDSPVEKVFENGWVCSSASEYVKPGKKSVKKEFLMKRDSNPLSFKENFGYLKDSLVSEWFTKLSFGEEIILLGATTTSRFYSQVYVINDSKSSQTRVRLTCQIDGKELDPGDVLESETFGIFVGTEEFVQEEFGNHIKKDMNIKDAPTAVRGMIMSYYYRFNFIDKRLLDKQLDKLEELPFKKETDYILIDAGYCKYWGDWLDNNGRFDDGMKYAADAIISRGYKAAIWVAPLVADPRSAIYKNNMGWFMSDLYPNMNARFTSPVERFVPNMGLKVVDPTNEEYLNYIKGVATTFKGFGFDFFKLDFLYPLVFFNEFSKSLSRVEALRNVVEIFRYAGGEENHVMPGLSQLSPVVGLGDITRISSDTGTPYTRMVPIFGNYSNKKVMQHALKTAKPRGFLNKKAWLNDYDCIVFNSHNPEKNPLMKELIDLIFENGASLWFGDDLTKMNKREVEYIDGLFKKHKEVFSN